MNLISLKNKLLVNPLTMWFNPLTIVKPPQNLLTWLMPPLLQYAHFLLHPLLYQASNTTFPRTDRIPLTNPLG